MYNKDITFIYMDAAEKAMYSPIMEEAKRRGYKVRLTNDKFAKCEIGFYCQHTNFPQYSKLSFIMLHDIIQQYGNWPDIWLREPWNKYDVGLLPSKQWVENWQACSQYYYTNPRKGMYKVGWPKADTYVGVDKKKYVGEFNKKNGLDDSKRTVLYAPSWENDGKQNDFVQAMLKLDVNILIKQAAVDPKQFPEMYASIKEMKKLHKDINRVTILEPSTNIFEAIMASDILVSDESSTMCEAIMMGIPAVSVSNWLIPDVTPKRFPECNYNFVFMTKKEKLSDFISNILEKYDDYLLMVSEFRERSFGTMGKTSSMIMDIVDDCVANKPIRYDRVQPNNREHVPFRNMVFHIKEAARREITGNYEKRYRSVAALCNMARKVKNLGNRSKS